jgi:hypothetical protein
VRPGQPGAADLPAERAVPDLDRGALEGGEVAAVPEDRLVSAGSQRQGDLSGVNIFRIGRYEHPGHGKATLLHLLAWVDDAQQLAKFAGYFASNLAREVARLAGWTDKIQEYEARNRGESFHERQFASPEIVTLEPLPFREASERLRSGERNARFPIGCFPPALPFVSG